MKKVPLGEYDDNYSLKILMYYNYRYYSPRFGRWFRRDPIGETGGFNLYAMIANSPIHRFDSRGMWGKDIHMDATQRWALTARYPTVAADLIAKSDEGVDDLSLERSWAPIVGNQGYHFNRNSGGNDSRLQYKQLHLENAKGYCNKNKVLAQYWDRNGSIHQYPESPEAAAVNIGIALHALQDWVAHGDYAIYDNGNIWTVHNACSPQTNLLNFYGKPGNYPDNPSLDAVNGIDGRAAGGAMHAVIENFGVSVRLYAIYQKGTKRLNLTQRLTIELLNEYRNWLEKNGTCKCRQFFGVQ